MISITIFCNTASLLRTFKRNILSLIMIFYDVTPCRYCTNVSQEREYQTTWCHIPRVHDFYTAVGMSLLYTATLLCLDNSHHASLRPFPVTAGNTSSAVIPVFHESGSTCSVQCSAANIKFLLTGAENVFICLADEWSIEETYCSLHFGLSLVKTGRRQINSDSCQIK